MRARCLRGIVLAMVLGVGPAAASDELLDLNRATVEELTSVPGIGSERAKMIVRVREKNGPFRSLEELLSIPRLTERQFERLREYLEVSEAKAPRATEGGGGRRDGSVQ